MRQLYLFMALFALLGSTMGVYVSPTATCGDTCDGSQGSPYATIQAAVNAVKGTGQVDITLMDGTYTGAGNRNILLSGGSFKVHSMNGSAKTIIDCEKDGAGFELQSGAFAIMGITFTRCRQRVCLPTFDTEDPTFFDGSKAINSGAAIVATGATVQLANCSFINNKVKGNGGAVALLDSTGAFHNLTFEQNRAQFYGGAIFIRSGAVQVTSSLFKANRAVKDGKHIFNQGGSLDATYQVTLED